MTDKPLLLFGDCVHRMKEISDASVDAIITDPPYPCIKREYGMMTEAKWHAMMRSVVAESRRILKPKGSAVFILQPNSEKIGRMRSWLWEFMAWTSREWNQVQDFWWWNYARSPTAHCQKKFGLARPSIKACVWLGSPNCYRNQDEILWKTSDSNIAARTASRSLEYRPSGGSMRQARCAGASIERGGVTPFNLIPLTNTNSSSSGGSHGHGAATPEPLCDRWIRYISPSGGVVCDPFMGSGTTGLAAIKRGRKFIGIENYRKYYDMSCKRINELCSAV